MEVAVREKRILLLLRLLSVFCIIAAVVCIVSFTVQGIVRHNAYESLVGISTATDRSERIESYLTAVRLNPGRPEAYLRLLETYAEDGVFEKQESGEFLSLYNANHQKLNTHNSQYPEMLKRIGFLYINGYNESTTTCIRMALPFLKEAYSALDDMDEEKQTVDCYCKIGTYYEEYIWNAVSVKEITPAVMESLISDIEETMGYFQSNKDTSSIYDYMGFSVAVCNLLFDQRDILAFTIPEERTMAILDSIYENLPPAQSLQKERTKQLLQTLEDNRETYYDMIERAYARVEAD